VVRWAGDLDLHAAVGYLRSRPDLDDGRIGAIGFSIGGEILLEARRRSKRDQGGGLGRRG
jgi:dienelactone hydrolase